MHYIKELSNQIFIRELKINIRKAFGRPQHYYFESTDIFMGMLFRAALFVL